MSDVEALARRAKGAAARLCTMTGGDKDRALLAMADALDRNTSSVLEQNSMDLENVRQQEVTGALMDRLKLDESRICAMAEGLREVVSLRDPVGEIVDGWRLPNGLKVEKVRVPLGVIGIIYEARPDVTVDASGLCLKSGNSVILRGSSIAINSNRALAGIIASAGEKAGMPPGAIQLVESTDRESARQLMRMRGLVDVLIPRGGQGLIRSVVENSTVPVIETGVGNCHIYVDEDADVQMAVDIVINAKTQRPGVCNSCETVLVHGKIADEFLQAVERPLRDRGVTLRGCQRTREILNEAEEASEQDWMTEYLELILAVKVIEDLDGAIEHINRYGSGHSDAIVTNDYLRGKRFMEEVDSSTVYINASTRFTDGGEFGMGAEIGISTQKLHARGPMSLKELTSTKFMVYGTGQVRG